jgi:hypothetical protein
VQTNGQEFNAPVTATRLIRSGAWQPRQSCLSDRAMRFQAAAASLSATGQKVSAMAAWTRVRVIATG